MNRHRTGPAGNNAGPASTNLPVGKEIFVQIYASLPLMIAKSDTWSKYKGAQGMTKGIAGNKGNNSIIFVVNSSGFSPVPDESIVIENNENESAMGTTQFNIY